MKNMIQNIRKNNRGDRAEDKGFTLVEILIAIVLVGILSAVVVVGISNLTSSGSKSACSASADAARASTVVYYASHSNAYPANYTDLTTGTALVPAALTLPSGVAINTVAATAPAAGIGLQITSGSSWQMTMTPSALGAAPTFVCTP
jgi:prepilin-type N-terminal cleavage/methylation domain-containing protein